MLLFIEEGESSEETDVGLGWGKIKNWVLETKFEVTCEMSKLSLLGCCRSLQSGVVSAWMSSMKNYHTG